MEEGVARHCEYCVSLCLICRCLCSYKLWYNYLKLRRKQVRRKCVTDPAYDEVNNAFERSLVFMHKVRERQPVLYIASSLLASHVSSDAANLAGLLPVPHRPEEGGHRPGAPSTEPCRPCRSPSTAASGHSTSSSPAPTACQRLPYACIGGTSRSVCAPSTCIHGTSCAFTE